MISHYERNPSVKIKRGGLRGERGLLYKESFYVVISRYKCSLSVEIKFPV